MEITRAGSQPSAKGPEERFTGAVRIDTRFKGSDGAHVGGPVEEVRPGDIVWFAPGAKHWRGATLHCAMTHIAIAEALDGRRWTGWSRSPTRSTAPEPPARYDLEN